MAAPAPVLRAGLTGGIASGKSTVASMFRELGAFIVDADAVAHGLIAPGAPCHRAVVERFGPSIVRQDGTIDRNTLGRIVFGDPASRLALNAILHPVVREELHRLVGEREAAGDTRIAVVDAALLVESGIHRTLHRLVVVRCGREAQLRRLLARGGLSAADAEARVASQAPLEDKIALADYVIDTETSLEETRAQTRTVWEALRRDWDGLFGGAAPLTSGP